LRVETRGEPVRISVCHCLSCRERTGSVFGAQARFQGADVTARGESRIYERTSDSGGRSARHFCPDCGSTVFWRVDAVPGFTYVAVGAFADPDFPPPTIEVYAERRCAWLDLRGIVERE
jgi:hypothetical protein